MGWPNLPLANDQWQKQIKLDLSVPFISAIYKYDLSVLLISTTYQYDLSVRHSCPNIGDRVFE